MTVIIKIWKVVEITALNAGTQVHIENNSNPNQTNENEAKNKLQKSARGEMCSLLCSRLFILALHIL